MIVLDASVLIAHLESTDAHHERAGDLLLDLAGEPLAASPLTIAEVLVGPARAGQLALARAALGELGVSTIGLDEHGPTRLATLRATTGLKLPDCCVVLAAEQSHSTLATFDARLATVARAQGVTVHDQ